jgi:hypothetical protein
MDERGVYRIDVRGRVPAALTAELSRFEITEVGDSTTLTGLVSDSAALYGILARLEAVGLALVAVRPLHEDSTDRGGMT